jgi:hypothetical protein
VWKRSSFSGLRNVNQPLALGVLFGVWFIGPHQVAPWNYQWLYSKDDGALTQLGFEFFREQPLLQWPITSVSRYLEGLELIVPTENGIVNLIGKLFGYVFKGNFQFVGIWLVTCFALQGYFGSKLLSRFVDSKNVCTVGSVFFVTAPALLFRIGSMNHYALAAQWMILFALYLYFDINKNTIVWSALIFVAVFTSIYITPMVIVIYFAHRLRLFLSKESVSLVSFFGPLFAAFCSFLLMGYMEMRTSVSGTNLFRLNVLAYVNPGFSDVASFSFGLNHFGTDSVRRVFSEEWEGFQYLGTITIFGAIVGAVRLRKSSFSFWQELLPISIAVGGMYVFALSNQFVIFQHEFSYWWPEPLIQLREIFRGTTRFGWPAYYLLILFGVIQGVYLLNRIKVKAAIVVLVAIMLMESSPGIFATRSQMIESKAYESLMRDPKWNEISNGRQHVVVYPNFDLGVGELVGDQEYWLTRWFDLAKFAADNRLSTNFGYAPRPLGSYVSEQDYKVLNELRKRNLREDTIYVLANRTLWNELASLNQSLVHAIEMDGYFLILTRG